MTSEPARGRRVERHHGALAVIILELLADPMFDATRVAALALDLDQYRRAARDQRQCGDQRRYCLIGTANPRLAQRGGAVVDDTPAQIGEPLELRIVKDNALSIAAQLHVEFDPVAASDGLLKGGEGVVLGCIAIVQPAMGERTIEQPTWWRHRL